MLKGLCTIAEIVKLAYVLAALLVSAASADDYRPARVRVQIQPKQTEPAAAPVERPPDPGTHVTSDNAPGADLSEAPEDPPAAEEAPPALPESRTPTPVEASDPAPVDMKSVQAEADSRPVVYFFVMEPELDVNGRHTCPNCVRFEKDKDAGKLPWFRFIKKPAPGWYKGGFPAFHYNDSNGNGRVLTGYVGPMEIVKAWRAANNGKPLRIPVPQVQTPMTAEAAFAQAAASDLPSQIRRFLGDEATIVIKPAMPINTAMDDGSIVKYSQISAHYKMVGNVPTLTIDDPKPQAWVRKFGIWFEADLQGARGNLNENPPTATLKTSRGDVKIKIGLEPQ